LAGFSLHPGRLSDQGDQTEPALAPGGLP
jgi:hypothetical protein